MSWGNPKNAEEFTLRLGAVFLAVVSGISIVLWLIRAVMEGG